MYSAIFMDFSTTKPVNPKILKNIIFDFGGVIINIDYRLTARAFEKLGVDNFENLFSQKAQSHLFDKLETGKIAPPDFRNELRDIINLNLSDEQIDAAWNAMLLDYPKHRLDFLRNIQQHYRTFLLSNTNQIHKDCYYRSLHNEHSFNNLDVLFEKLYFSHEVGLRKPDPAIYKLVLDQNRLKPEETLFIDDSLQNLATPQSLGIQVYHLTNGEDIVDFAKNTLNFTGIE